MFILYTILHTIGLITLNNFHSLGKNIERKLSSIMCPPINNDWLNVNTQKSHFVGIIIKVIALTTPMTTVAALGQTTASIAIGMGLLALARTLRTKAFVSCSSRDHA